MADEDDILRIDKKIIELRKDLKEANRLHKILDEYCTDSFKEAFAQISKTREDMAKVVTAVATTKKK